MIAHVPFVGRSRYGIYTRVFASLWCLAALVGLYFWLLKPVFGPLAVKLHGHVFAGGETADD